MSSHAATSALSTLSYNRDELERPASQLFLHNLTGVLEQAIRSTNAQFEDRDVLQRVDVKLLEASPGDCGWDVFSLAYHVDGPLSVVFSSANMIKYLTSKGRVRYAHVFL